MFIWFPEVNPSTDNNSFPAIWTLCVSACLYLSVCLCVWSYQAWIHSGRLNVSYLKKKKKNPIYNLTFVLYKIRLDHLVGVKVDPGLVMSWMFQIFFTTVLCFSIGLAAVWPMFLCICVLRGTFSNFWLQTTPKQHMTTVSITSQTVTPPTVTPCKPRSRRRRSVHQHMWVKVSDVSSVKSALLLFSLHQTPLATPLTSTNNLNQQFLSFSLTHSTWKVLFWSSIWRQPWGVCCSWINERLWRQILAGCKMCTSFEKVIHVEQLLSDLWSYIYPLKYQDRESLADDKSSVWDG